MTPHTGHIAGRPIHYEWHEPDDHGQHGEWVYDDTGESLEDACGLYEVSGYTSYDRKASGSGNASSCRINIPIEHRGKRVRVIVLDP